MADCFHHLPCAECVRFWDEACAALAEQGVDFVSVTRTAQAQPGRLGKHEGPGWITLSFGQIRSILSNFLRTNFVQLGAGVGGPVWVGREERGAPMGDSLSSSVLRLFKLSRERMRHPQDLNIIRVFHGTRVKLARVQGCSVLVLDISFRDDLRHFLCVEEA